MRKRKSPIAKNLINNSVSGMFSAIEIHNKPSINYRYEMVVLLILNAWELLLKGYLYKYHKDIKLFSKDGTTKPFENCVNIISQKIGINFNPIQESLNVLYAYRNQVAHFYIDELDPIVFSLISKNIIFYSDFLKEYFRIDLSKESNLIILPIGFKRLTSPIDYISTSSFNEKSSPEVKAFLQILINATLRLNDDKIEDTIFVDFRMNLINVNKTTNADIIARIDNSRTNLPVFTITKNNSQKIFISTNDAKQLALTHKTENTQGILIHEELSAQLFDEINNVVDANNLIAKGQHSFVLGELAYYRIYTERNNVANIEDNYYTLANGGYTCYAPFLFWISKMEAKSIAKFLIDTWSRCKHPNVYNLIVLTTLLGKDTSKVMMDFLNSKFKDTVQKPNYYYTFSDIYNSKKVSDIRLIALRASESKSIALYNQKNQPTLKYLLTNEHEASRALTAECMALFSNKKVVKTTMKTLDIIENGYKIFEKASNVYEEIIILNNTNAN